MATVLGAGTPLAATWSLDPVPPGAARPPAILPAPPPAENAPTDSPETLDLLARIVWLLGSAVQGLPLGELRVLLSEPSDSLQRALAAGLRTKRLRRVGAHSKLRYVLNR